MLQDPYYRIDPTVKKSVIVSLRYWLMVDLSRNAKGERKETNLMLNKLKTKWQEDFVTRFFEEAWNGLSGTFLRQNGIEPLIMQY